jgi:nucleotide-binding universal stress UspA family protein
MDKKGLTHSTLVPIDFSVTSLIALDHAAAIANISEDNVQRVVTLLHVIEGSSFDPVYDIAEIEVSNRDALAIEGGINRLQSIIDKYKTSYKVNFRYIIVGGKPSRKIAEVADKIQAQSIVMGTHGSSGLQALAGSNASRVIQLASCPVIVVKERPLGEGYKNIVLPLDLSKETKQKVNVAAQIAKYFNATIHIATLDEKDEFLANRIQANLTQVEDYFKERGIQTSTTNMSESNGNFALQTLVWAQGKDADLIIIMAQQEKGLSEYIFGSYAQQIVNRSTIPVMTITPMTKLQGSFDIM